MRWVARSLLILALAAGCNAYPDGPDGRRVASGTGVLDQSTAVIARGFWNDRVRFFNAPVIPTVAFAAVLGAAVVLAMITVVRR